MILPFNQILGKSFSDYIFFLFVFVIESFSNATQSPGKSKWGRIVLHILKPRTTIMLMQLSFMNIVCKSNCQKLYQIESFLKIEQIGSEILLSITVS